MNRSNELKINIDAFACTLHVQGGYMQVLEKNFNEICNRAISQGAKPEFSASRYLRCMRVIVDNEGDGAQKILWIQIEPISPHDPAIRFELKGHPLNSRQWKRIGKILHCLTSGIPIDIASANVTRIDIAIDRAGSLDELYCHKLRTKVSNITLANGGSLACLRFGKSTSNSYLCVYGKDWTESRTSPRLREERVRFEYRFKPRVPLSSVIADINLEDKIKNVYVFDKNEIKSENLLNSTQLAIANTFGITPLILSGNANEKRNLLRRLKPFRQGIIKKRQLKKSMKKLQKLIDNLFRVEGSYDF